MTAIDRAPVNSKLLKTLGYHPESQTLAAEFGDGKLYHYADVSPEEYAALQAAESVGSHFLKHIVRGGKPHTRIDG